MNYSRKREYDTNDFNDNIYIYLQKTYLELYKENEIKNFFPCIIDIDYILVFNDNILCFQNKWNNSSISIKEIYNFYKTMTCLEKQLNKKTFGFLFTKKKISIYAQTFIDQHFIINIFGDSLEEIKILLMDYFYEHFKIYLYDNDGDIIMKNNNFI
uniref:Restriction endonuclease type IV Mrr domain-containing protein n=1 Tax=viral metagenome TaxID=1070528 RepID=A0A6C0ECK1_9ZZZZ